MKKSIFNLFICGLVLFCSCNDLLDDEFISNTQSLEEEELPVLLQSINEPPPSPMEWVRDRDGTMGTPGEPNYLYIGTEPEFTNDNEFKSYVYFDWYGQFGTTTDPEDYYVQIQWSHGPAVGWHNINTLRGNGLVKVLAYGALEDISAYALPYDDVGYYISLRIRKIHKNFLSSIPNLEVDYSLMYDINLVSEWATSITYRGFNSWGYGQPQPEQNSDGTWPTDPDVITQGHLSLRVEFPLMSSRTFSFDVFNYTGGYQQPQENKTPNFVGISKINLMAIGQSGGLLVVDAKCIDPITNETTYSSRLVDYGTHENAIIVSFSEDDFKY